MAYFGIWRGLGKNLARDCRVFEPAFECFGRFCRHLGGVWRLLGDGLKGLGGDLGQLGGLWRPLGRSRRRLGGDVGRLEIFWRPLADGLGGLGGVLESILGV